MSELETALEAAATAAATATEEHTEQLSACAMQLARAKSAISILQSELAQAKTGWAKTSADLNAVAVKEVRCSLSFVSGI
jgi:hypothetical protein